VTATVTSSLRLDDMSRRSRDASTRRVFNHDITSLTATATVCVAAILAFGVLDPVLPVVGLDPSWRQGLAEASRRGIGFGGEFAYTYGPLGPLHTRTVPRSLPLWITAASLLYCVLTALLALRTAGPRTGWSVALVGVGALTGGLVSEDTWFIAPAFLLPLLVLGRVEPYREGPAWRDPELWLLAVYSVPVGMLPLVKFSGAPLAGLGVAIAAGTLIARRRPWHALVTCGVPGLTFLLVWTGTGQSLADLGDWIRVSGEIASGYSAAMATPGSRVQVAIACAWMLVLTVATWWSRPTHLSRPGALAFQTVVVVTVFLAFKGGFVRPDGHVLITASTLLLLALTLRGSLSKRAGALVVVSAVAGWVALVATSPFLSTGQVVQDKLHASWVDAPVGAWRQLTDRDGLRAAYSAAEARIREDPFAPDVPRDGTVDLYTYELSYLFAQDGDWRPRPVMQSFAAYTPLLADLNRAHLAGPDRPEHLLLNQATIDNRWPALEDGASWLTMATHYDATPPDAAGWTRLDERARPRAVRYGPRRTIRGRVDRPVSLGRTGKRWDGLVATVELSPSLTGRLRTFLYRPSQVTVTLTVEDGSQTQYKYLPAMGPTELVVSPQVASAADLASLVGAGETSGGPSPLAQVRSLTFGTDGGRSWSDDVTLVVRPFRIRG